MPTTNGSAHGLLRSASTSTCGLGHRAGPIVRRCVPLGAEGLPELLLNQSGAHAASGGLRPARSLQFPGASTTVSHCCDQTACHQRARPVPGARSPARLSQQPCLKATMAQGPGCCLEPRHWSLSRLVAGKWKRPCHHQGQRWPDLQKQSAHQKAFHRKQNCEECSKKTPVKSSSE